jgi:hypothetical protein
MIVHTLHAQHSQLTSCGWIDCGEFRSGRSTGLLSLLAADTGGWLWRRLVLRLVLLVSLLVVVTGRARRAAGASEARLILALV